MITGLNLDLDTAGLNTEQERIVVDQENLSGFEDGFKKEFLSTKLPNPTRCVDGKAPDGKGGCKSTKTTISSIFGALNLSELNPAGSDIVAIGDGISGVDQINGATLSSMESLGNKKMHLEKYLNE